MRQNYQISIARTAYHKACTTLLPALKSGALCFLLSASLLFSACSAAEKPATTAQLESSYHRAWELLEENTMFPDRLSDWKHWEHRYDGKLKNKKDLEEALTSMISSLSDEYTYFRNEEETQTCHKHDEDYSVVSACRLPQNVAYIAIHSFSSLHTANELESALQQIDSACGIILDLRGNRGGYVEQALLCYELLSNEGTFTSMKGREEGKPYSEMLVVEENFLKRVINGSIFWESRRKNLSGKAPLVVLVDVDTRSAAEMLAGALRDTRRAKLVGGKTFGKGVVQSSWNLEAGCSIKIAMARYFLPSGADINGTGIMPDFYIDFQGKEKPKEIKTGGLSNAIPRLLESSPGILKSLFQTSEPHRISASAGR